jgi:hypothetical protein
MQSSIAKIVSMIDYLAKASEELGDLKTASKLDSISQLVLSAEEENSSLVNALAMDLRKYFPTMDVEQSLVLAKNLQQEYGTEGEEKEGYFPLSALPHKFRREGPRPEDVPVGTTDWWSSENI